MYHKATTSTYKISSSKNVWLFVYLLFTHLLGCTATNRLSHPVNTSVAPKTSLISARVVIDAGHGGKDCGSIGPRGLKEKDITLDIAKKLGRLISTYLPNVEVVYTRKSDTYVSLEKRVRIANQKQADVFLSLHINASENKSAHGFEVFSLDVASDRHSERLAMRENSQHGRSKNDIGFILADLRAYSNRKESDNLASFVSSGLRSQLKKKSMPIKIVDRGYNQAIFHVLFVKMPAVLAELFFISNPREEALLANNHGRELIARGLFLGVNKYLQQQKRVKYVSNKE